MLPNGGTDMLGTYGGPPYGVFKFSSGARPPRNGQMLIYHNTSLINTARSDNQASPFSRVWDNAAGLDIVLRNNSLTIKEGQGSVIWIEGYAYGYTFNLDIDFNNLWRSSGIDFAEILGKSYLDHLEMQGDGYELHGISENPQYTDPAEGDFGLPEGSPLVDAGLHIPGINDEYYGFAPDIGAVEYTHHSTIETEVKLVNQFKLQQNFPNPFNPVTEISYNLPYATEVDIGIYNLIGQRVVILVQEKQSAGQKTTQWNGKDKNGIDVSSGMYLYRLRAGEFSATRKILLVR